MASEELKVTVGVNGAKEFKNQLKDVNAELKESDKQFKETEKTAKILENGVEGVEKELEALGNVLEAQNKKVQLYEKRLQELEKEKRALREEENKLQKELQQNTKALEESNKANGENSKQSKELEAAIKKIENQLNKNNTAINKNVGEYNKLQRELTTTRAQVGTTEAQIGKLQQELNKFNTNHAEKELNELEESAEDSSEKIQNMTDVSSQVSDSIGGFFKACFDQYMNAEDSINKLQNTMGVSRQVAEDMYKAVLELSERGFDFEEAQESVIKTKQVLGDLVNGDELPKMSDKILRISKNFDVDLNDIIRASSLMMRNFGIDGNEALDIIVSGYRNGLDVSGDFLDTFSEYSVQFKAMGLTAEDSLNILNKGMKDGAFNTDKIADALKEAKLRMLGLDQASQDALKQLRLSADQVQKNIAKGGEPAKKQIQQIKDRIAGLKSETDRNTISVALFGTQFEDLGSVGVSSLDGIDEKIQGVKGSSDELGSSVSGVFGDDNASKLANIKQLMGDIGGILAPIVGNILDVVGGIAEFLAQHPELVKILGIILLIVGAITGLITVVGSAMIFVLGLNALLAPLGLSLLGLSGPFLIVIGVIMLVIGVGWLLYDNWEWICKKAEELGDQIQVCWEVMCKYLSDKVDELEQDLKDAWNWIYDNTVGAAQRMYRDVTNWVERQKNNVLQTMAELAVWFQDKWDWIYDNTIGKVKEMYNDVCNWMDRMKNKISNAWDSVTGFFDSINPFSSFSLRTRSVADTTENRSVNVTPRMARASFAMPNLTAGVKANVLTTSSLYSNNEESNGIVGAIRSSNSAVLGTDKENNTAEIIKAIKGLKLDQNKPPVVQVYVGNEKLLDDSYKYTVNKINRNARVDQIR